jgi:hypothetical protein
MQVSSLLNVKPKDFSRENMQVATQGLKFVPRLRGIASSAEDIS